MTRLRSALRRLDPILRPLRRIAGWWPLTWRSALAVAVLVWVLVEYGLARVDLILLVLGGGGLGLIALSLLMVLVTALAMRLRALPPPDEPWVFQTEAPFRTGLRMLWLPWIPLVQVELEWLGPKGVEVRLVPHRGGMVEEVVARRRAVSGSLLRRWTVSDAFGMARVRFERTVPQPIKILPAPGRLRPRELLQQMSSGDLVSHPGGEPDGDLIEMRRYTYGDPLKRVLWKAYARTRRLLVRLPERAIAPRQKTLAYLVADPRDEPAAGTARAALEQGVFGHDFLFCADGEEAPTRDIPEAVEQIVRSASQAERGGAGLGDFLAQGQAEGSRACVVFAPATMGGWVERVEHQIATHRGKIALVLTVDGLTLDDPKPLWRRVLLSEGGDRRQAIKALRTLWDRLSRTGAPVTVIDRATGAAIHPEALRGRLR